MKLTGGRILSVTLLGALIALSPATLKAGATTASAAQGGVYWQVTVPNDGVSLRVIMPDGSAFERSYASGQSPSFNAQNGVLPDGAYTYELVMSPVVSPEARARAVSARDSGQPASLPQGSVESGTFRVVKGAVVFPDASAVEGKSSAEQSNAPEPKDQVIPDDLIVQGSICTGFDCVNGEDFGFDTLRLKENNTRIQFNDTSTGSFPTNNWQIRANSSESGGPNFLAFVDQGASGTSETGTIVLQVAAGAGANALMVSSGGDVGFGTGTPVVKMHATDGNTPTLRLEQNGSSGFTPQTWDVAGNETNFFIRDATNGSTLPFRIQPGAPSSSIFIKSDGKVGFGTSSPETALHARSSGPIALTLHNTTKTNPWTMAHTNANNLVFNSNDTMGPEFEILATGGINVGSPGPVAVTIHNTTKTNPWTIAHTNGNNLAFNSNDTAGPEFEILATGGIRVSGAMMNVPDYVFQKNYKLRSVDELASFVREKGHLPGVTSAKEVAAAGSINITEMQMQMLEKIEELTLYTIQQQELIQELKTRLGALEKPVKKP